MLRRKSKTVPQVSNDAIDAPINMEELYLTVKQGKKQESPGYDGICHDFFRLTWEIIKYYMLAVMNQMFIDGEKLDSHKHGILVCLP
jgi:hypothetical protein